MPVEIKKTERETSQALIHRFKKAVQQSGVLLQARKGLFTKRIKGRNSQKKAALRRVIIRKEYERDQKMSKPKERSFRKVR
ncbi:MAG: hypothetical protein Q7T34_00965 [Candidatus Parcubacteria bacterium]|nr:hypothetical protein [Candidatus Parcubacteria bacterium]